jgi:AraC-like DNA-binding protein
VIRRDHLDLQLAEMPARSRGAAAVRHRRLELAERLLAHAREHVREDAAVLEIARRVGLELHAARGGFDRRMARP